MRVVRAINRFCGLRAMMLAAYPPYKGIEPDLKARKALVKIRRTWGNLRPVTKVKPSAKIYNRKKIK